MFKMKQETYFLPYVLLVCAIILLPLSTLCNPWQKECVPALWRTISDNSILLALMGFCVV